MSEILVNTIKNSAGNATDFLELGIAKTGSVLQVLADTSSTEVSNSSGVPADVGVSVAITPSSATNYFLVTFEGHFSAGTSGANGGQFNIYKDGVKATTSPNDGGETGYDVYKDESRIFTRLIKTYYAVTGTTSEVTFTTKFNAYSSSVGPFIVNAQAETTCTLTVMEIAG